MNHQELTQKGFAHHQQGEFSRALDYYEQALRLAPEDHHLLFLKGTLFFQVGKSSLAMAPLERAIELWGEDASYHNSLGSAFQKMALSEKALDAFAQSVRLDPEVAGYHFNLARAFQNLGQLQEAVKCFNKCICLENNFPDAFYALGQAYEKLGNTIAAEESYQKMLSANPLHVDSCLNLGKMWAEQKKWVESEKAFSRAREMEPKSVVALSNLGYVFQQMGRLEESRELLEMAVELDPRFVMALTNLGQTLFLLGEEKKPIFWHQKALGLDPSHVAAMCNLGMVYHRFSQWGNARGLYLKGLGLDRHNTQLLSNLGVLEQDEGNVTRAESYFKEALAVNYDLPEVRLNLAMAQLKQKNFIEGWKNYEFRLLLPDFGAPSQICKSQRWDGSDLRGKTIVIYMEQGAGDAFQFVRYLPFVTQQAKKTILLCSEPLRELMEASFGKEVDIVGEGFELPHFDCFASMMSLPAFMGELFEPTEKTFPYLRPSAKKMSEWSSKLRVVKEMKVGVVWAGNDQVLVDRRRSMKFEDFNGILHVRGVRFYALSAKLKDSDSLEVKRGFELDKIGLDFKNWHDTAAVISQMDLVVSTCTGVAHLAGALGVPVWILLNKACDWRWFKDDRVNAWYRSATLFRQASEGDWSQLIQRVCREMEEKRSYKS